jgi:hypothetical protein
MNIIMEDGIEAIKFQEFKKFSCPYLDREGCYLCSFFKGDNKCSQVIFCSFKKESY